jgi:hypothetical protein
MFANVSRIGAGAAQAERFSSVKIEIYSLK